MKQFLTPEEVQSLKQHKYNGKDDSLLIKYVLSHFWNWIVEKLPLTLAPNLITLYGMIPQILTFLLTMSFSYTLEDTIVYDWIPILNGLSLLWYQTMDNLDGKQARRTGSSSPLGQFFDHGCDAITGVLEMIKVCAVLDYGVTPKTFYVIFLMSLGFVFTTWEEFVTHKFYLGYINAPGEGLFFLAILQIVIGFFPEIVPFLQADWIFISFYVVPFFITTLTIFCSVIRHLLANPKDSLKALIGLVPTAISSALILCSFYKHKDELTPYLAIYSGLLIQFGAQILIVTLIVSRSPSKLFHPVLVFEWICFLYPLIKNEFDQPLYWWFCCIVHFIFMFCYDYIVVCNFADALGIEIFTIKPKDVLLESGNQKGFVNVTEEEDLPSKSDEKEKSDTK